jgi:hypothetical protein
MLKKYKIVALLLSMLLLTGIAGCGKSKTSKGKEKTSEVAQDASNIPASESATPALTVATIADQEDIPIELRILAPEEFGRDNPFVPLTVTASSAKSIQQPRADFSNYIDRSEVKYLPPIMQDTTANANVKKPEVLPDVHLTLVIDGNTAIFEENRSSKVLSVGETVGGMKIQEIRRDGAVLINGNKKYTASPGGRLVEIPSPIQPQQKQAVKTSKPLKAKKK